MCGGTTRAIRMHAGLAPATLTLLPAAHCWLLTARPPEGGGHGWPAPEERPWLRAGSSRTTALGRSCDGLGVWDAAGSRIRANGRREGEPPMEGLGSLCHVEDVNKLADRGRTQGCSVASQNAKIQLLGSAFPCAVPLSSGLVCSSTLGSVWSAVCGQAQRDVCTVPVPGSLPAGHEDAVSGAQTDTSQQPRSGSGLRQSVY